ncbi:UPF0481 protein At3g47200-like [Citrus sinensis]|uniref:UPF0481 protein At3g47200-like n=1 Tax=Citrus sinensis TaxID=2711 RepID=UPI0022775A20|nr:UPF0481 protein At3g47200-like [Citrus sinensis]
MTAIGPFTYELRSRDHLKGMEEYKKRFLKKLLERQLLERRGEQLARTLVSVMRKLEGEARKCYSEKVSLTSHQFVEMMLLDACFIVELFCYRALGIGYGNDHTFRIIWNSRILGRDLLLAHNQLPLFVLQKVYDRTTTPARPNIVQVENEFIRIRCATELQEAGIKFEKIPKTTTDELPELPILFEEVIIQTAPPNTEQVKNEEFIRIRCATELQEAGIKFEKIPKTTMDELPELPILFEEAKGIMKISELTIDNGTESLLRNLTDYEQYQNTRYGPLVSYIDVMDGLINTVKDVKILCESGILTNCLGDEEVVAQMFNRLGVCVRLPPENNYKEMLKNVNKYCDRKWNKWMANLWHNYFNTPWAIISFFAALVLLILAAVQTVFSVLAYFKSSCLGEGLVLLISSVFMNVGQYCRVLH